MRIARIRIFGFRGIRQADIKFGKTSVLIGPNNVGKTTIIEALALVLGRDGMVRSLTEHDFWGSNPKPADRIRIVATIAGFGNDPSHCPEWFSPRRGVPKWYDSSTGTESASPKDTPFELVCEIGFQARFDFGSLEVETIRYFYDDATNDDVFVDDSVVTVPIGLVRDIGLFLIPATRLWDRMISFGSELFRRVVSSDSGLPAESIIAERDRLRAPDNSLENDPKLKPIIDEVNKEISSLFGKGNEIHLRVTATDSSGVLDAVVPHFGDEKHVLIPSKRQGSGLISLQSLFLLLHFGKRRIDAGKGFCLALEEPELHLPPSVQRRVLHRLRALSSQVIVSTHSPLIAGFSDPTELLVVSNKSGNVVAAPMLAKPLDGTTPNAIRALYQLKRVETANALMAEAVLIPEGIFDFEWLSLLNRIAELQVEPETTGTIFSSVIGMIPTQNGAVVETTKRICTSHFCVVSLVDGDQAGIEYAKSIKADMKALILRWPDDWTIENVIGWIIEPDNAAIIKALAAEWDIPPASLDDLVIRLKNDKAQDPAHLKGDRIAYESIARLIADHPASMARVKALLDAIALSARGQSTMYFEKSTDGDGAPLLFKP
jgi:putative ATP-dependent endonuclease of OLD family